MEVVFREVEVYDGTGAAPFRTDVAISGDRIAAIGSAPGSSRETIDGRRLAIAPGFIDVHTHDDFAAVKYPDMAFKLTGGVTTVIVGNCGFGVAPFAAASVMAKTLHPEISLSPWEGYRGYAAGLERNPAGTNVGILVGHGTVRLAAMGTENRAPSTTGMAAM